MDTSSPMLSWKEIVAACRPPESHLRPAHMERLGIRNLSRVAKSYNVARRGAQFARHRRAFRGGWDALVESNGSLRTAPAVMQDGWVLDTSRTLPHLDALLDEAGRYIAERGMQKRGMAGREFIRDILRQEDLSRFPSFLNFITSSEVLSTVSRYLGFVPVLSTTVPPGVRFVESSADGQVGGAYQHSQLYHLDLHDRPLVYVIVLLRDVTVESGPFTFLPAAASARGARAMRYLSRGSPYRVSDERMYSVVDPSEARVLAYPRGTVLFIDTSRCFHFGSRDAVIPRYQMMYTYLSPCRTDFTESYMTPRAFPIHRDDSPLRRMVLGAGTAGQRPEI